MAAAANEPGSDQWPLWEVFTQAKDGAPHEHAGSVHAPDPDKPRTAGVLGRLIRLLTSAGSLATAGTALIGPLQALVSWLGPYGAGLLALLA